MIFSSSKTILYFTKTNIKVAVVSGGNTPQVSKAQLYSWTSNNLNEVLLRIKKATNASSVRIVLDDSLAYVTASTLASTEILDRQTVQNYAQKLIPENLADVVWDYKEIGKTESQNIVQIVAITSIFLDSLSKALGESKFKVEAIEPASIAIARLTQGEKDPHLILFKNESYSAIIASHGAVYEELNSSSQVDAKSINSLISSVTKKFSIKPAKILLSGAAKYDSNEIKLKSESIDLDPIKGLAIKSDISGNELHILNLNKISVKTPDQSTSEEVNKTSTKEEKSSTDKISEKNENKLKKNITVVVLIIIIIGIFIGGYFVYNKRLEDKKSAQPSPSPTTEAVEEIDQEQSVNLEEYKIQILNGSGIAGEAAKIEILLKDAGFANFELGNADTYDYIETEIQSKDNISVDALDAFSDAISSYSTTSGDDLTEDNEYDVIITVGTAKIVVEEADEATSGSEEE